MDPITHGMIGLAISTFSGKAVNLDNPIAIGCALGAMSPDLDTITRLFKDDAYYLKHHRGASHSIPMLAVFSVAITAGLYFIFPGMAIWQVLLWTFIGALSHTAFDILNSYGAMLLRKKRKLNLLTLYDPIITGLGIWLIAQRNVSVLLNASLLVVFATYMVWRYYMKKRAVSDLVTLYNKDYQVKEVTVLPSLMAFYKWDYIVKTKDYTFVGKYNQLVKRTKLIERFDAQDEDLRAIFDDTSLGAYFNDFSPNLHIVHHEDEDHYKMRIIDLRFYVKNRFLHHATLEVKKECKGVVKSELHPYKLNKRVSFTEAS
ncbi:MULTISPECIES: metal-dependent hydrolase [unclassified Fusibacter]|uniref:metal-dependent hydrolase n=1 Tax=unclassified Fusibacter TaxID=2624464 RepID=UPI001011540A|nr:MULTISPECIES: metal-dependent hydrolase [unclassified Fusibacter]MCK8060606.1 metal-dependent hydrolase [Fusibacter sp. A2]NPE22940.1 metal-dependent hydrolase [Fusibacter sp. A1]RXV60007.1 metal-dependent hydrolase [Fusibacter sp. A1]